MTTYHWCVNFLWNFDDRRTRVFIKASFVYSCMQTRLMGQCNGWWPICLVYVPKPLTTAITAIKCSICDCYSNCIKLERFSNDCRKTNIKVVTPTNDIRSKQRNDPIRIPSKCMCDVTCSRRGKCRAYEVRLVLVLVSLLIGWKSRAKFLSQSLSVLLDCLAGPIFFRTLTIQS